MATATAQSASARPAEPASVHLGVFIGCDHNGNLTSYHGNGTGLPGSTTVETYFNLLNESGDTRSGVAESNLRTTSSGTVTTPVHSTGAPYVGAQFNVYLTKPRDALYQTYMDRCLAGCRVQVTQVQHHASNGVIVDQRHQGTYKTAC